MRRLMDWTLENNMVDGLFFCANSQAAEQAIPYLYKQELKRPTPVRRRLSRTHAVLGRAIPGGWCRCQGWKYQPLRIPLLIRPVRRTYFVVVRWTVSCAAGTSRCLDLSCRAFPPSESMRAGWSRCAGFIARCARNRVGWVLCHEAQLVGCLRA